MTLEVAGQVCSSVSTDTRTLAPGALFVALKGPAHDGHDHVVSAFEKGAAAAVVERPIDATGATLIVPDCLEWLQDTARRQCAAWGGQVVAVTGSAGKTTAKDAIAAVLATSLRTGKTSGNFNNHIGVPLSVLNLPCDAEVAVLEMGMNHTGEIRHLATIAPPNVAVVTNVGTAHMEAFDSIEEIALAKRELVEALSPKGTAVLNADDARVRAFAEIHAGPTLFYGLSEHAQIRAADVTYGARSTRFTVGGVAYETRLPARGGVLAALAAIAVGRVYGIQDQLMQDAIAALEPPKMRLERIERNGMVIWNDCYNSNPEAAMMMLDLLAETPATRRIAVLGEMLELGRWSKALHSDVGIHAARCGISVLVGVHGAASSMVEAARDAGLPASATRFFDHPHEAGAFVKSIAQDGDALLFKGSRGTRVELALEEFLG